MTTATLTLTCVLLAAAAPPPGVMPMKDPHFKIPVHVDEARRSEFKELQLAVSTDRGKTWSISGVVEPSASAFNYTAQADGEYWFTVVVVDQQGNQDPRDPSAAPPGLKVLVDTLKPELKIASAERQGEEVVVTWEARDDNLDLATLKLEYATPDNPAAGWIPAPIPQIAAGTARLRPSTQGRLQVRMTVRDLAENQTITAPVEVAAVAGFQPPTTPLSPPSSTLTPPTPFGTASTSSPGFGAPGKETQASFQPKRADIPPVFEQANTRPLDPPPVVTPTPSGGPPATVSSGPGKEVAHAGGTPPPVEPLPSNPPSQPRQPTPSPPPLQVINKRQVKLEYEVGKVGPSGIGSVDVYMTRDEGRNWQLLRSNGTPGAGISVPPEGRGPQGAGAHSLTVTLSEEGIYGFYLVIKNGAGLGKPPPDPGTMPHVRLELDLTPPEAILFEPRADPSQHNTVILSWQASDHKLAPHPITLEWAERPDQPWKRIVEGDLDNSGHYLWKPPEGIPANIYLRLTVRDQAGNVSVAETHDAVLIDLNEPELKGVRFRPEGEGTPEVDAVKASVPSQ